MGRMYGLRDRPVQIRAHRNTKILVWGDRGWGAALFRDLASGAVFRFVNPGSAIGLKLPKAAVLRTEDPPGEEPMSTQVLAASCVLCEDPEAALW